MELGDFFLKYPETNSYWYILRFLRARNFHLQKAKEQLLSFFQFRDQVDMRKIQSLRVPENFQKERYVRGYYHISREGYPINIE